MTLNVQTMLERAALPLTPEEIERLQSGAPVIEGWLADVRFEEARRAEPAMQYSARRSD
jgi:hypothetical protein